MVNVAKSNN